jgi:hypothetical protein
LNKSALLLVVLAVASLALVACGGYKAPTTGSTPPSKIIERVLASQSVSSATAAGGLVIINGQFDTLGAGGISAGTSPGLMAMSPQRSVLLAFDLATNKVDVVNTAKETLTGAIQLPGSTTSIVVPQPGAGYAAVPSAAQNGTSPGAVVALNLSSGGITATISVPNAQTVVSNPNGTQVLAFSNDSDSLTAIYPALLNTASPDTVIVPLCSGCRPVNAVFSSDGSTAYILNCGAECGGTHTSVQILNMTTTPPTPGASVPVDGATIGVLNGSVLYVVGNSPTNSACTGEATAATTCGRLDVVDLNSMTVTGSAVITDGYHNRIDMGNGGQLFIGSMDCTNVGNVNNVAGEVRGCLTIYNTTNGSVVIPPDNGDVTGLQSFTSRFVEYVAEGGNLRVYDLYTDALLPPNQYVETGTIIIPGFITDVKAIDFF